MQLEVLFSKVWNGEDVTTLVQQLADNMSQQLGVCRGHCGRSGYILDGNGQVAIPTAASISSS